MNIVDKSVLKKIYELGKVSQRHLADVLCYSLGKINQSIQFLQNNEYIDSNWNLTDKSQVLIESYKPKKAIILAAGLGMRMVPINTEVPKALLKVKGQTLIERLICQLHEVGVYDICVVVGFMKEEFEFLIDDYNVSLVCNMEYARKNNMYSLDLVNSNLENTYIVPCDIWCEKNPFSACELYSWYMIKNEETLNTSVRLNKKFELAKTKMNEVGDTMIGISYISFMDAPFIRKRISSMSCQREYEHAFWEDALYVKDKMIVSPYVFNKAYEVKMEAQKAFDAGATVVKVENNAVKPRSSGWNSNSATYYFGDVLHGSKGTIRCYVVAGTGVDHVTNCSFSVEVWGTGFSLLERYIVNNNTMNVAGKWKCLQSGFVNVVSPQYSVSLF